MLFIRRPAIALHTETQTPVTAMRADAANRAGSAITIGNFDGVHRGHRQLLSEVVREAKAHNLCPTVLTLNPHPRELFDPSFKLARISTLRDRVCEMHQAGIGQVCILPFNREVAALDPTSFVRDLLVAKLSMKSLWVGDDFRFGAGRQGDLALLKSLAPELGFQVYQLPEVKAAGQRVSSSNIRSALAEGDISTATALLGRPLVYTGRVKHGKKLGRTLGFPTMNMAFAGRASALSGILAVWVHGLEPSPLPAVASLGVRPTVEQSDQILLETYIPNWSGNAYGKLLRIEVSAHLRPEQHFDNLDLMVEQMHKDTSQALTWLAENPSLGSTSHTTAPVNQ